MSTWGAVWNRHGRRTATTTLERMLGDHASVALQVRRFGGEAGIVGHRSAEVAEGRGPRGGRLIVVADARLDARAELTARLLPGAEADAVTDADLILAAYRAWGRDCPKELVGDFSFFLRDDEEQVVVCARDPLGVRPLYYALRGSTFCAATEMEPLRRHPLVSDVLDEVAVSSYLMGRRDDPERSLLRDVRALGPGQAMRVSAHTVHVDSYWSLEEFLERPRREGAEAVHEFAQLFQQAVADRLRPRRGRGKVGISMSGGLDSTSVATVADGLERFGSRQPVTAWSMVFDRFEECDERRWIRELEEGLGIEVRHVRAERFWPLRDWWNEEPALEDPVPVWSATRRILRDFVQDGGSILLTGHGGDNLLSGSFLRYSDELGRGDWTILGEMWRHSRRTGDGLLRLAFLSVILPGLPQSWVAALPRKLRAYRARQEPPAWLRGAALGGLPALPAEPGQREMKGRDRARWVLGARLRGLADVARVAQRLDRVAQPLGIDVRHPFLDRRLVEFVATLAPKMLVRDGWRKWILREALRGRLPEPVRTRPTKTRLTSYLDHGIREQDGDRMRSLLRNTQLAERGYVAEDELREELERYLRKESSDLSGLLAPITLERWLRSLTRPSGPSTHVARRQWIQGVWR